MSVFDAGASMRRYDTPLIMCFADALAVALHYGAPQDRLMALYEIDHRTQFAHHGALLPLLQVLEQEVGA